MRTFRAAKLPDLFRCPACASPLAGPDAAARCPRCGGRIPRLGGVPVLLPRPRERAAVWAGELAHALARNEAEINLLRAELAEPIALPRTRRRLRELLAARLAFTRQCRALYQPLARRGARATARGGPSGFPMYRNVLRDWCWGERENRRFSSLVLPLLPRRAGRLLVLGAGAARLAYDVHRSGRPACTVALDINPFELLAADAILRGRTVALHEFPPHPNGFTSPAPLWRCRAPAPAGQGLLLVLADGRRVPAPNGAFDAVLTPYFLDATGAGARAQALEIARLLKPGGCWVNIGPLAFDKGRPADALGEGELLETVRRAGFRVGARRRAVVPHMESPACGFRPAWEVLVFSAERRPGAASGPASAARAPHRRRPPPLSADCELLRLDERGPRRQPQPWLLRRSGTTELWLHEEIARLVRLLDGRRSLAALASAWKGRSGPSERDAVRAVVETLTRGGFLGRSGG